MIKVDESIFTPFFDWCNSNEDSEVDREEFIDCSKKGSEYFQYFDDMPWHGYGHNMDMAWIASQNRTGEYKNYIHDLIQDYYGLVDDGYWSSYHWRYNPFSLSFDEFKYTMAGLASVDAGLILKVRLFWSDFFYFFIFRLSMKTPTVSLTVPNSLTGERPLHKC